MFFFFKQKRSILSDFGSLKSNKAEIKNISVEFKRGIQMTEEEEKIFKTNVGDSKEGKKKKGWKKTPPATAANKKVVFEKKIDFFNNFFENLFIFYILNLFKIKKKSYIKKINHRYEIQKFFIAGMSSHHKKISSFFVSNFFFFVQTNNDFKNSILTNIQYTNDKDNHLWGSKEFDKSAEYVSSTKTVSASVTIPIQAFHKKMPGKTYSKFFKIFQNTETAEFYLSFGFTSRVWHWNCSLLRIFRFPLKMKQE